MLRPLLPFGKGRESFTKRARYHLRLVDEGNFSPTAKVLLRVQLLGEAEKLPAKTKKTGELISELYRLPPSVDETQTPGL